jgi:hypothetical protein
MEMVGWTGSWSHLVQVYDPHCYFPETLSPVDIGLGHAGNTTSTEF